MLAPIHQAYWIALLIGRRSHEEFEALSKRRGTVVRVVCSLSDNTVCINGATDLQLRGVVPQAGCVGPEREGHNL